MKHSLKFLFATLAILTMPAVSTTFTAAQPPPGLTLTFPRVVNGPFEQTGFAIVNPSTSPAILTFRAWNEVPQIFRVLVVLQHLLAMHRAGATGEEDIGERFAARLIVDEHLAHRIVSRRRRRALRCRET